MKFRHQEKLKGTIPPIDLTDRFTRRQFAAEYSQSAYEAMLREERAVGYYLKAPSLQLKPAQRKGMIVLIEDLQRRRGYKLDSFYLAVSIADHYLATMGREGKPPPCLLTLAITSLLIAAKIEEPHMPRFENMTHLLRAEHGVDLSVDAVTDFEHTIMVALDFQLRYTSPGHFLDRYQRLFALDREA